MRKYLLFVLTIMLLVVLTACDYLATGVSGAQSSYLADETEIAEEEQEFTPEELESEPEPELTESDLESEQLEVAQDDAEHPSESVSTPPESFTIEQIQVALEPEFQVGAWGDDGHGFPQVISAERVAHERGNVWIEPFAEYVDFTDSVCYRVTLRYRESIEIFNERAYSWPEDFPNPFSRDGDYTILISYYYFHDVNGNPQLVVVVC